MTATSLQHTRVLEELRQRIHRIERRGAVGDRPVLPFRIPAVDERLPEGGLALGVLHEVSPSGPELTHAAAAGLFVAGVLARLKGPVLWCLRSRDLFAPGLAGAGLNPGRVLYAETYGGDASVLLVMEGGLRHGQLAGVVGEVTKLTMTGARRLQLAAETSGVVAVVLRRWTNAAVVNPTAAVTRWRLTALPSAPLPVAAGIGRPRWRVELTRCRGGEPAEWLLEACDATGHLGVPADLADRPAAAEHPRRAAAR
jgi:protein ImuA